MKRSLLHIILLVTALGLQTFANAQSDPCIATLKDAQTRADQGWYDEAISMLNTALTDCKFSREDEIEARKLLIIHYLQIDYLEEADASAARIMKLSPNFEPDRLRDPIQLVKIFRKYKPAPVLNIAITGGVNFSQIELLQAYSIIPGPEITDRTTYNGLNGWQIGLKVEKKVWSQFWIIASTQFRNSAYEAQKDSVQDQRISYNEQLSFVDFAITGRYYIGNWPLQPFAEIGGQYTLLNSALGELSRPGTTDLVNRLEQRNRNFSSYHWGGGLAYTKKGISIRLGVQVHTFSKNLVNPETRFDNLDVIFKYFYLDNDIVMNHLQVNIGLAYAIRYRNILQNRSQ